MRRAGRTNAIYGSDAGGGQQAAADEYAVAMTRRIALIPGDGVGPEVLFHARRAVDATGVSIEWTEFAWGSAFYRETGAMMPSDGLDRLRAHDAVLLGACGDPRLPDDVTLWGLTLRIRQGLDLWANVRPARLLEGVPCPLRDRTPSDVDMLFVRENTEGEYSGMGGRSHTGTPFETAVEAALFTRSAIERIVRYAFELARSRRGVLTSATKSNASRYGYALWDTIAAEVAGDYPDIRYQRVLVDALAARMVLAPASVDVVVGSNLFADILTDLAAALQGGMGMAASANLAPDRPTTAVFEPVHGSAPDIAGRGIANPCAAIWSAALMLDHIGEADAGRRILAAVEHVCREGPKTPDIGGTSSTDQVGDAIVDVIAT